MTIEYIFTNPEIEIIVPEWDETMTKNVLVSKAYKYICEITGIKPEKNLSGLISERIVLKIEDNVSDDEFMRRFPIIAKFPSGLKVLYYYDGTSAISSL